MARASLKFDLEDHWVGGKMLLAGAPPGCKASLEVDGCSIARAVVQSDSSVRFFGGEPVLPVGVATSSTWEVSINRAANGELHPQLLLERREPIPTPYEIPVDILNQKWMPAREILPGANNSLFFACGTCALRYCG